VKTALQILAAHLSAMMTIFHLMIALAGNLP